METIIGIVFFFLVLSFLGKVFDGMVSSLGFVGKILGYVIGLALGLYIILSIF